MKKEKRYKSTRFSAEALLEAFEMLKNLKEKHRIDQEYLYLSITSTDGADYLHDTVDEFICDFRQTSGYANFVVDFGSKVGLKLTRQEDYCVASVFADTRAEIESIFAVFDRHAPSSIIDKKPIKPSPVVVFIGHGRSAEWRDLKDHLQDKHGYKVEAYETGARAGHTIRDILEDMMTASSFAILVMSGEDEQSSGQFRARQNVIHEAGLFQGKLGFPRAIILLEHGVEQFSNVQGVQYIPFSKGNIKECFGEVLATLRREFPSS